MDYIISILPQMWLGTIETLKLFFITIVPILRDGRTQLSDLNAL